MSANLHLLVEVGAIPEGKSAAVASAIARVLSSEGLEREVVGPVDGADGALRWSSDPASPLIISAAHRWIGTFTKSVLAAVRSAARGAKPEVVTFYDEERRGHAERLRAMRAVVREQRSGAKGKGKGKVPGRSRARLPVGLPELERVFGKLQPVAEVARDGFAIARGRLAAMDAEVLVTCGLAAAGHGLELYVLSATPSDGPFAIEFIAKLADEVLGATPASNQILRADERVTVGLGRIQGKEVLALIDPDTGALPRVLKRDGGSLALVPATSVTKKLLAARTTAGVPFENADALGEHYPWFLRARDPSKDDASRVTKSKPAADTERRAARPPRPRARGEMRRFELISGSTRKFWSVGTSGKTLAVSFGRIGTMGQSKMKPFPSPREARAAEEALVEEKTKEGYREV